MRRDWAMLMAAVALVAAACGRGGPDLPGQAIRCGGTEAGLCHAVANLAIAQMNLTATGPITEVVLEPVADCAEWGRSNFRDWRGAAGCWRVTVTGERSHGWGSVIRWPDGRLEPVW